MNSVRRPRLPKRVYVVRRILVLIVFLLLLWMIVALVRWMLPSGDADKPAKPAVTATASPTPKSTPAAAPQAHGKCDLDAITFVPSVPAEQKAKKPVALYLGVSTTQAKDCELELEAKDIVAVVQRGDSDIWSAKTCGTALLEEPIIVSRDWLTTVKVEWSGRRSGANCAPGNNFAEPGTYTFQIATLGGEPGKTKFVLDKAPAPKKPEENSDSDGEKSLDDTEKSKKKTDSD